MKAELLQASGRTIQMQPDPLRAGQLTGLKSSSHGDKTSEAAIPNDEMAA